MNLSHPDPLAWFAQHGGKFTPVHPPSAPVSNPGKQPVGEGWPNNPYTLDAIRHKARQGFSAGLLTGEHSEGLVLLDVDRLFLKFLNAFSQFTNSPRVVRADAPDKAKLVIQLTEPVANAKWKPVPVEGPYLELLSTGNHGVVYGNHPEGAPYELINADQPIPILTRVELDAIWHKWTREHLEGFEPQPAPAPRESSTHEHDPELERLKDDIRARFDMVRYACQELGAKSQRENAREVRILGQGGMLIHETNRVWNTFGTDGTGKTGGDCFALVAYLEYGSTETRGRRFWEVLDLAANFVGIPIPESQSKPAARKVDAASAILDDEAASSTNFVPETLRALRTVRTMLTTKAKGWDAGTIRMYVVTQLDLMIAGEEETTKPGGAAYMAAVLGISKDTAGRQLERLEQAGLAEWDKGIPQSHGAPREGASAKFYRRTEALPELPTGAKQKAAQDRAEQARKKGWDAANTQAGAACIECGERGELRTVCALCEHEHTKSELAATLAVEYMPECKSCGERLAIPPIGKPLACTSCAVIFEEDEAEQNIEETAAVRTSYQSQNRAASTKIEPISSSVVQYENRTPSPRTRESQPPRQPHHPSLLEPPWFRDMPPPAAVG